MVLAACEGNASVSGSKVPLTTRCQGCGVGDMGKQGSACWGCHGGPVLSATSGVCGGIEVGVGRGGEGAGESGGGRNVSLCALRHAQVRTTCREGAEQEYGRTADRRRDPTSGVHKVLITLSRIMEGTAVGRGRVWSTGLRQVYGLPGDRSVSRTEILAVTHVRVGARPSWCGEGWCDRDCHSPVQSRPACRRECVLPPAAIQPHAVRGSRSH